MKANKGVAEIKFCYPMFACEGKLKAVKHVRKAVKPHENTSQPLLENNIYIYFFWKKDFLLF